MKGVYVLIIHVKKDLIVNVGALGKVMFEKGIYAYVGSARTNLEKRIERHLGKKKRKFWHVDYLLDNDAARIARVFIREANKMEECRIALAIGIRGEPIVGFGCSDCNCNAHLFHIRDYKFLRETWQVFPIAR